MWSRETMRRTACPLGVVEPSPIPLSATKRAWYARISGMTGVWLGVLIGALAVGLAWWASLAG